MYRKNIHTLKSGFLLPLVFLIFLIFFNFNPAHGQFYNGSQLKFGKKRVQYENFFWTYYRYDRFDTYFYLNGKELAIYAAEYADKHIKEIELELQSTLEEKVQFVIFNNLTDLKQSNIGLTGEWDSYNTGGVTRIIGGKVLLYFDGNYEHFEQQIRAGVAMVLLNEMVYGTGIGSQIKNNAIFTMPEWYLNGLISYISRKWNTETDNVVRDAILNGKYTKFNALTGVEAAYAGHSLWNYIARHYGETNIPNIIYMARMNRNIEKGFFDVLGVNYKTLMSDWLLFYQGIYQKEDSARTLPAGKPFLKKFKKERIYRQLKVSPGDEYAAWCTHELGIYKVFVRDLSKGKTKRIFRGGYRLEEKEDYSFPVLAWHPSGDILAITIEKKGESTIYFYSVEDKRMEKQVLFDFEKILDISYSSDGSMLVLSALKQGQSDIFVYNIASGSYLQITKDIYNDLYPRFLNQSKEIIFSSNRENDTIRFDPVVKIDELNFNHDIFIYDFAGRNPILKQITRTPQVDEIRPAPYSGKFFSYLSDYNGIYNRFVARFDSAIAFIDTTTHYRYYTTSFPVTNYSRSIIDHNISAGSQVVSEVVYRNNKFELYMSPLTPAESDYTKELQNSGYRNILDKSAYKTDTSTSISKEDKTSRKGKRFSTVMESDIVNDTARVQPGAIWTRVPQEILLRDSVLSMMTDRTRYSGEKKESDSVNKYKNAKILNYNVEYSVDQTVAQIDLNYLNSAYQPFTGSKSPIFINPGMNALFMIGVTDLMEDYRLMGGIRLNFNLVNNEYLFSYANQRKRIDHQIIFHRQSLEETGLFSLIRHRVHELYYIATYPFTPVLYVDGTASVRYDRAVFLATDQVNLTEPDIDKVWASLKGELTYDNTRKTGLNLYNGTRYKIFGEYYNMVTEKKQDMVVVGADFRHYRKIHRSMILALRLAASTSFGNNKLVYYMGGVDNWFTPSFDDKTPVSDDQNYAFQTLATNMRGFKQNIRNGNSFAVINSEVRMPIFRYFLNRAIRSSFLNNLQLVAFGDVGTAWTGWSPYSKDNRLFINYIEKNPLFIKVEMMKDPVVEGFGFGLRSHLFGYFLRGDLAWGVEDGKVKKPIFYFSLSLDF